MRDSPAVLLTVALAVACGKTDPPAPTDAASSSQAPSARPSASASAQPTASAPSPSPSPTAAAGALNACDVVGHSTCFDAKWALLCVKGSTYEVIPCKGPKGCHAEKDEAVCDDNVAAEGDPCIPGTEANYSCTADKKTQLLCKDHKFAAVHACRGPHGCTMTGSKADCDATLAEAGDPCEQNAYACRTDHAMILECKWGKFVAGNSCDGPKGCTVNATTHKAECDDSVAKEGEPCEPANEERCSSDKRVELRCQGGKYAKKKDCPRHGCTMKGTAIACD